MQYDFLAIENIEKDAYGKICYRFFLALPLRMRTRF